MRTTKLAIVLIAIAAAVRLALASVIPLLPDETYYWEWSRNLAAGYFDHPPAIALLIHAGTTIFGDTPLGVRFGAILAGTIASCAMVVLSLRLGVDQSDTDAGESHSAWDDPGARAAMLMLVIPGALVGFVLATPDAPLLAAIALTLTALERAIASQPRSRAALGWWCAAGLTLGIAFCSKFTSVLIPGGVFVALLTRRDLRRRLAEPGPYLAAIISFLVLTPTLIWNARHHWISFAFQLNHGFGQTHGSVIGREIALVGGQLGLISPIIAVLVVLAVAHNLRSIADQRRYLLAVIATTVVAFFVVSALRKPVEPNWPVPALVAGLPLLATTRLRRGARKWLNGGVAFAVLCTLLVGAQAVARVIPVNARRDPISKAYGWNDVSLAVQHAMSATAGCSTILIAADRYQDASELAFNLPGHPRVFALNLGGRANQYDLWPSIYSAARPGNCALIVTDEGAAGERVVHRIGAESVAPVTNAVLTWRGSPVGRRAIWIVRGIPSERPAVVELSPSEKTALIAETTGFSARAAILDSIVTLYRRGPGPHAITETMGDSVLSTDRKAAITARVSTLRALLQRSGFKAVYRDARYDECTFVRSTDASATDMGYVYAPPGCRLANGHGDGVLQVDHAEGSWYSYAAPAANRK
jgi:4-amino-4-deoxy-L-arabinose transferase-like glycosyltransferase